MIFVNKPNTTMMLDQLLNIGLQNEMPRYQRRRVRPANAVAFILFGALAIPFSIVSRIYFPPVAYLPMIGGLTVLIYIGLTLGGYFRLSRFIVVVVPAVLVTLYQASLCGEEGFRLSSMTFMSMIFIVLPFVIVDTREKGLLALMVGCNVLLIVGLPVIKTWMILDVSLESQRLAFIELLERGWLSYLSYAAGIASVCVALIGLAQLNRSSEEESEAARQEAERRSGEIQQEKLLADENLKKLSAAQGEEDRRRWASEGITQLSDIMRSQTQQDEEERHDRIIAQLVNYLESNQGALYIIDRETEDVTISMVACYAYARKKHVNKRIDPGEGLIGQAYLEKAIVHLTEIPANYLAITSGLGHATPRSLVIVPLLINDTVEGILEIATFRDIEEHHITFLEKAGESLASFIQMDRINARTKYLLTEAQQQTEEMRAQEEEMRQNMEELAATQEEMHRKEQAYERRIQDLEAQLADKDQPGEVVHRR